MAESISPRAHCTDFYFLILLVLSIITQLLPHTCISQLFPVMLQGPNLSLAQIWCNCCDTGMGDQSCRCCNTAQPSGRRNKSRALIQALNQILAAQMPIGLTLKGRILTRYFFSKYLTTQDLDHLVKSNESMHRQSFENTHSNSV